MAARWGIVVWVREFKAAPALFPVQPEPLRGSAISRKTGRLPQWETRSACQTRRWATMRLSVPELTRELGKRRAVQRIGAARRQDSADRIVPRTSSRDRNACPARIAPPGLAARIPA